jgi:hypothetical protein
MSYRISGFDVHKKVLAVVVSDVEVDGEFRFERRMFGSNPEQLRSLAACRVPNALSSVRKVGTRLPKDVPTLPAFTTRVLPTIRSHCMCV